MHKNSIAARYLSFLFFLLLSSGFSATKNHQPLFELSVSLQHPKPPSTTIVAIFFCLSAVDSSNRTATVQAAAFGLLDSRVQQLAAIVALLAAAAYILSTAIYSLRTAPESTALALLLPLGHYLCSGCCHHLNRPTATWDKFRVVFAFFFGFLDSLFVPPAAPENPSAACSSCCPPVLGLSAQPPAAFVAAFGPQKQPKPDPFWCPSPNHPSPCSFFFRLQPPIFSAPPKTAATAASLGLFRTAYCCPKTAQNSSQEATDSPNLKQSSASFVVVLITS